MPLSVNPAGTTTWVPAKTAKVMVGGSWIPVKKMKTRVGASWVLSWVHPVVNASLSLSKSGVNTSEAYNVTLTAPGGFPEGAEVVFRFTGYSYSVFPTEGSVTATLTGASHASAGSYAWYADVKTKGGDTTFGPVTQSVAVVSTTVGLTGPDWVISTQSGSGGASSAASKTFTITLSNSAVVTSLSFQLSYAGGAWTQYASWGANPGASVSHTMQFATQGSWRARAVATLASSTVYSGELSIYCYKKDLYCSASPSPATVGDTVTLSAWHGGDALGAPFGQDGRWQYMYTSIGVWNDRWSANNPQGWLASGVTDIQWRWWESYSDGSWIVSNVSRTIVNAPAPTEVVVDGGHCHNIQAGMDSAASQGLPLRLTGTFYCYTNVYIPDNLYITATNAHFYLNSGSPVSGATFNAGRWKNNPKGNAAGYGQAGGFTIDGGTFEGNGEGCMTFSHSPGYTVKNARFFRYCRTGNTGHALEMNSSGGPDNVNGAYTVQILNNQFLGTDLGQRTNSNDEPLQFDWNWDGPSGGSGSSPPVWYPGDPVSESTQVMCHNILIQGNTFHRWSEGGAFPGSINGGFALCAIGGHDSSDASVVASYRHNHFLITGNVIHGAVGSTATSPNKGAIHLYRVRQAVVQNNTLYGGVQNRFITAEDATDKTYCSASGNATASPALTGNNTIIVEG
jgi:hypothetical protein